MGDNMVVQTKGYCKYCGKEYAKAGMLRHLQACKERKNSLSKEIGKRRCRYFEIVISDKYLKEYWLIIEANENTTLKELDEFIRDIWVECCGHLSMFTCNDVQYESCPDTDSFWGMSSKNMNFRLKDVVEVGDTMLYEYDFGSTTKLVIKIHSCRDGERRNNEIVILSRNTRIQIVFGECRNNKAKWVNPQAYYYDESPFWCEKCLEKYDVDDEEYFEPEIFLPICNSPRMGVCGYDGSRIYPDQFEPDTELGEK